jgi:RNA polymerase sigma-70 factor (ECF subfamily)
MALSTGSALDEEGFFDSIRRQLERAVRTLCPHWPPDHRDDVVQAASLRVLQIRQRSEGAREFNASYLWRVAYTALIDETRRRRGRREDPMSDQASVPAVAAPENPERDCSARQIGVAIRSCLGGLVRPRRLAVVLYLQGYGVPEAARLLGWPRKRTENLVYRGLADLRRCLSARGIEP